jgi:hypothetical protein
MSRRLALAEALLGNPGTLLLDEPTHGLSPKNTEWFHAFLRAFAAGGGSVLATVRDPNEAAALADHVVTLDGGRLVADQTKADFVGGRLRDEVSVRGPQVGRLADLLAEAGAQVRREGGAGIAVVGVSRTQIGELAYRHGILLHELADRTAGSAPGAPAVPPLPPRRSTEATAAGSPVAAAAAAASASTAPAQPGETVVVLTPGSAVSASVPVPTADTATRSRVPAGLASVSGPLYRDEPPVSDQRSE